MVIRLLDYIEHCSSYAEGEVIFNLLAPAIKSGEDVTLSFDGVSAVPSAFVNGALVRLAEETSISAIQKHLKIVNSTRQINDLVRSRFAFLGATSRGATSS
jgi:STAS-like domain of unknown function (DUF4325)